MNTNFRKNVIDRELSFFSSATPNVSYLYILCDSDAIADNVLMGQIEVVKSSAKNILNIDKSNVIYLKYKNRGEKFENFLSWHSNLYNIKKLEGMKNDTAIYTKVMGKKLQNFENLYNTAKIKGPDFIKLFTKQN